MAKIDLTEYWGAEKIPQHLCASALHGVFGLTLFNNLSAKYTARLSVQRQEGEGISCCCV
jgi:hypothetical protein